MGLAVAEALAKRGNWSLHLLDLNEERGKAAAANVGGKFYKTNVNK
jgi:NAD(P)-dependent dehydrogenase (short-subunit alcohol dehydrogenase family)